MITSLVTGGAGFIGSHVAEELIKLKHKVIVLDDLSGGFKRNIPRNAVYVNGSITNVKLIEQIFSDHKINYVYHFAAYAAEGLSHYIRNYNYQVNQLGSINLINAAVNYNVDCFVFASSIAVYGSQSPPMTEAMHPKPEDPYGVSKYAVELDLAAAHEQFGLDYIIFRPHNVYGERQNLGDKYRNVIGIFLKQAMQNTPLTIFGNGEQSRAFSYIDDIALPIAHSVTIPSARNKAFNIGSAEAITVNKLASQIQKVMDRELEIKYLSERNEVFHAYADHQYFYEVFDIQKETSLKKGLAQMAKWAQNIEIKPSSSFENIEIKKNFPEHWKR